MELTERYLAAIIKFCPSCEKTDAIRRLPASTEFKDDTSGKPLVRVFYCCTVCHADWWELYSLVGLEVE